MHMHILFNLCHKFIFHSTLFFVFVGFFFCFVFSLFTPCLIFYKQYYLYYRKYQAFFTWNCKRIFFLYFWMSPATILNGALRAQNVTDYQSVTSKSKSNNKWLQNLLTHISKQCRPRLRQCCIWSGCTLFALSSDISTKHDNNKN